jgi:density-regulated protein
VAEKLPPVRVLYCGVCDLPAEYCEFAPDFERCKPWLRAHAPGVYPDELIAPSSSGLQLPAAFLPALLCLRGLI